MDITVVGCGYVGLVTGLCFAEMGHHVVFVDVDEQKMAMLSNGIPTFYEPGLKELLHRCQESNRVIFTTSYKQALQKSDICFLALPTMKQADGSADLSFLCAAAQTIASIMDHPLIIVNKSTAPVGTVDQLKEIIQSELNRRGSSLSFDVIANPEFLKEGSAIQDCMKPDRIIIGAEKQQTIEVMKKVYKAFSHNHDRIITMDIRSAEMTKYAANIMLASRISLMNELASFCEEVGANIHHVRVGIGSDQRIGYQFLYAGMGFGGSCFPKDIAAIQFMAEKKSVPTPMIDAILNVNEHQKTILFRKIERYFDVDLSGVVIAIWGLSFKPETDDIREAPSIALINLLLARRATLHLYDPKAMNHMQKIFAPSDQIKYFDNEYAAAVGVDAIALVTEWKQFRFVDHKQILSQMKGKAFFDGRNQYNPIEMSQYGYDYFGIGVSVENSARITNTEIYSSLS